MVEIFSPLNYWSGKSVNCALDLTSANLIGNNWIYWVYLFQWDNLYSKQSLSRKRCPSTPKYLQDKYHLRPTNSFSYLFRHTLSNCNRLNKSAKYNLAGEHVRFVAQNVVPIVLDIKIWGKQDTSYKTRSYSAGLDCHFEKSYMVFRWKNITETLTVTSKKFKNIHQELSLTPEVDLICHP